MTHPVKVPKLVLAYIEREKTYDKPENLAEFIRLKIKQCGRSPSLLTYMTGMTYSEARSALRWIDRLEEVK